MGEVYYPPAADNLTPVLAAVSSGIPRLYEWGGLVTLLVLFVCVLLATIFALGWVIWQMYKNNQSMSEKQIDAMNRQTNAVELLTQYIKGMSA